MEAAKRARIAKLLSAGKDPVDVACECLTSYDAVMEIAGQQEQPAPPEPATPPARKPRPRRPLPEQPKCLRFDQGENTVRNYRAAPPGYDFSRSDHPTAKTCQFPTGDPRSPDFTFCGSKEVVRGRPYCHAHCAASYIIPTEENKRSVDTAA